MPSQVTQKPVYRIRLKAGIASKFIPSPFKLRDPVLFENTSPPALRLPLVGGGQGTKLLLAQAAKKVLWASLPTQVVRFDRVQGFALLREAACV